MAISETKMQIVIANYFKDECDVNTSIKQAFEKGFRIGVKKGANTNRPQGDSVSRRYLLAEIDDLADEFSETDENGLHSERWCGISDAKCVIANAPSVADEPQGEWLKFGLGRGTRILFCTNCERRIEVPLSQCDSNYDFCPNCGARMKGANNE